MSRDSIEEFLEWAGNLSDDDMDELDEDNEEISTEDVEMLDLGLQCLELMEEFEDLLLSHMPKHPKLFLPALYNFSTQVH